MSLCKRHPKGLRFVLRLCWERCSYFSQRLEASNKKAIDIPFCITSTRPLKSTDCFQDNSNPTVSLLRIAALEVSVWARTANSLFSSMCNCMKNRPYYIVFFYISWNCSFNNVLGKAVRENLTSIVWSSWLPSSLINQPNTTVCFKRTYLEKYVAFLAFGRNLCQVFQLSFSCTFSSAAGQARRILLNASRFKNLFLFSSCCVNG